MNQTSKPSRLARNPPRAATIKADRRAASTAKVARAVMIKADHHAASTVKVARRDTATTVHEAIVRPVQ